MAVSGPSPHDADFSETQAVFSNQELFTKPQDTFHDASSHMLPDSGRFSSGVDGDAPPARHEQPSESRKGHLGMDATLGSLSAFEPLDRRSGWEPMALEDHGHDEEQLTSAHSSVPIDGQQLCTLRLLYKKKRRKAHNQPITAQVTNWPAGPSGTAIKDFDSVQTLLKSTELFGSRESLRRVLKAETTAGFTYCRGRKFGQPSVGNSELSDRLFVGEGETDVKSE